jgi:hypothetical protein
VIGSVALPLGAQGFGFALRIEGRVAHIVAFFRFAITCATR